MPRAGATRLVDRIFKMRELAILLVFLVMIAITQAGNSEFLSEQGIKAMATNRIQLIAGQRLRNGLVMQPYGGYDLATAGVR